MKKRMRMIGIGLVLVATLLLATVPTLARSTETDFEAIAFICGVEPPVNEWYTDGGAVLHQRGVVVHSILVSDEPRMNGIGRDIVHQDLNLITGDGRAWGHSIFEMDAGIWRAVWKGELAGFLVTTHASGHGSHGFEAQAFVWEGQQIPIPEEDPCPNGALQALFASGVIVDHKGD
jgi:hypothetical protein